MGPGRIVVKYRVGMKILPVGDRGGSHPRAESPPLETFRKRPERSERPNSDLRQTKPALQAVRLVLLRAPPFVLLPVPSSHRLGLGCRRSPRRTLFPEPAMPENLLDHLGLAPLDEGDDFHLRTTLGTRKWVRLVNLLNERRPALARLPRRGRLGWNGGCLRRWRLP